MPDQSLAGFPVYWQSMGAGELDGLLIHCSLAHSGTWDRMMQHLDGLLTAKAFVLPGHGRSGDWGGGNDFQGSACVIAAELLDKPTHIIGHSFGATVALRLAVEYPHLVKSLTLIEPVYFAATKGTAAFDWYFKVSRPFHAALESGDLLTAVREFVSVWGAGGDWLDMSGRQRADLVARIHLIPESNIAIIHDADQILATGRLEGIEIPTLLLESSESPEIIPPILDVLEHRIPDTRRALIHGAAHMAPITHSKAVADHISVFLSKID